MIVTILRQSDQLRIERPDGAGGVTVTVWILAMLEVPFDVSL